MNANPMEEQIGRLVGNLLAGGSTVRRLSRLAPCRSV